MVQNQLAARMPKARLFRDISALEVIGKSPFYRTVESAVDARVTMDGTEKIMLASNNYLGLANHPEVRAAAKAAIDEFGAASTGSRAANGSLAIHRELEAELADWHGTESAITFPTGYQANVGTISAVAGPGDLVVIDAAAHTSIRDGARLSGATVAKFPHNDAAALRAVLAGADDPSRALVVVDGLYSMEGDLAPLPALVAVCAEFDAMLMVDEAHSVGIHGDDRTGACALFDLTEQVDIRMGTLSKGIGAIGGFVAGPRSLVDYLRTNARAYLFTTSGVPAAAAAALAGIRIIRSAEGEQRARSVLANSLHLRDALREREIPVGGASAGPGGGSLVGPIVPALVGDEMRIIAIWNELYDRDVYSGVGIFPGVAYGQTLLRLLVTADHRTADLDRAADIIADAFARHPEPAAV
ncbi:aminotransferase class I/II-fold pyridoxal phosphate-dependent enzyme [Nocardia sp. NPDC057353]|uniref:aminotransferase class I/II-fold pyridoxal phosphate-dependent enzyme n=1 Tax=Nocardia sp. NPDC057353 TaxID=3346104 RepID=UPI00363C073E